MLFIFGKRIARIGKWIDTEHICYPCKSFDREVVAYRPYFHFCFIPVFPIGKKQLEMHCRNCGDETRLDSVVRQYEARAKTPFYLYSALILFVALAAVWFYWNRSTQKHKIEMVSNPSVGDVYTIREESNNETTYYFLRLVEIRPDTVMAFRNHLDYSGFVSSLASDDYFVKTDTLAFRKSKLKDMLENGEIYSLDRGYSNGSDFNRLK
jgi:zinc-ribbon family